MPRFGMALDSQAGAETQSLVSSPIFAPAARIGEQDMAHDHERLWS